MDVREFLRAETRRKADRRRAQVAATAEKNLATAKRAHGKARLRSTAEAAAKRAEHNRTESARVKALTGGGVAVRKCDGRPGIGVVGTWRYDPKADDATRDSPCEYRTHGKSDCE